MLVCIDSNKKTTLLLLKLNENSFALVNYWLTSFRLNKIVESNLNIIPSRGEIMFRVTLLSLVNCWLTNLSSSDIVESGSKTFKPKNSLVFCSVIGLGYWNKLN